VPRQALPIPRLRAALKAWDVEDADVLEIKPGVTSDVFLVMHGGARFVAKYCYDYREYFEVGLRASTIVRDRLGDGRVSVSVPVPAASGELTQMVAWPDGVDHPLALLTYVPGDPVQGDDADAPELLGEVCGRVHASLLGVEPRDVGITQLPTEPDGNYPDRDAGGYSWLHSVWRELEHRAWESRDAVRTAVGVWDGPDIRRARSGLSLLDFGHCGWHSVVHVVANRSLIASLDDETRFQRFMEAVERHLPFTDAERELFRLHRLRNAAIYARWVATEKVARNEPDFNETWFGLLLDVLRSGLPQLGVATPA
jgi:Ser/Thr protein kinase RdoA (MazF antagonist)